MELIRVLICILKPCLLQYVQDCLPPSTLQPLSPERFSFSQCDGFLAVNADLGATHGHTLLMLGSHISSDINHTISLHPPSSSLSELRQAGCFGALLSASNSGMSESSRVAVSLEQPFSISFRILPFILFGPLNEWETEVVQEAFKLTRLAVVALPFQIRIFLLWIPRHPVFGYISFFLLTYQRPSLRLWGLHNGISVAFNHRSPPSIRVMPAEACHIVSSRPKSYFEVGPRSHPAKVPLSSPPFSPKRTASCLL